MTFPLVLRWRAVVTTIVQCAALGLEWKQAVGLL